MRTPARSDNLPLRLCCIMIRSRLRRGQTHHGGSHCQTRPRILVLLRQLLPPIVSASLRFAFPRALLRRPGMCRGPVLVDVGSIPNEGGVRARNCSSGRGETSGGGARCRLVGSYVRHVSRGGASDAPRRYLRDAFCFVVEREWLCCRCCVIPRPGFLSVR